MIVFFLALFFFFPKRGRMHHFLYFLRKLKTERISDVPCKDGANSGENSHLL